jgi:hypothetical protein
MSHNKFFELDVKKSDPQTWTVFWLQIFNIFLNTVVIDEYQDNESHHNLMKK